VLLVVGDSISAGGPAGAGWVDLLAARIASGPIMRVVNGSITGDDSGGGRGCRVARIRRRSRHRAGITTAAQRNSCHPHNLDAMVAASTLVAKTVIIG
jgi:lysophospholipase L1-like esterase